MSQHCVAPAHVVRGSGSLSQGVERISRLTRRPLLLGRSDVTSGLRRQLASRLKSVGVECKQGQLYSDCCESDLHAITDQLHREALDGVIAMGGGKVLDAGKLLAHRMGLACVTVPTSAATCAGWTALANVYSPEGAFVKDEPLDRCPDLLIFDHDLVRRAPQRTLASGIADAMAKWYEASVSSGSSSDGLVQQAVQMARVLRDQVLLEAEQAIRDPLSDAWVRVAEACALTAGLVGGIGGARCRTVAAHAVHNGLTQLAACHPLLHGEKVAFGILVQLRLEELLGDNRLAAQGRRQLISLFRSLDLPVTLSDLGLADASVQDLQQVCDFALREDSDLHHLPFRVEPSELMAALVSTAAERQTA